MNLSSITTSSIATGLHDLMKLLQSQSVSAGQQSPDSDGDGASEVSQSQQTAAPPSVPAAQPSGQFAANTLSALISAQQAPPTPADIAAKLISAADTNGDGSLSLAEVQNAISPNGSSSTQPSNASPLNAAFGKLDTNGDGVLSADELATALQSMFAAHKGHHHHGQYAAASALASSTPPTTATAATTTTASTTTSSTGTNDPAATTTSVTA